MGKYINLGELLSSMTIQRQLLNRAAICTTTMIDNQTFTLSEDDINASNIEVGDELTIALTRTDVGTNIKPNDREIFTSVLAPNGLIVVPNSVSESLELEADSKVKFVAVPNKNIPGPSNGPIRDRLSGGDEEPDEEMTRPERTSTEATFSGVNMRQTGQISIPNEIMGELGLIPGDKVRVLAEYEGNQAVDTRGIQQTRNRVQITKAMQRELGIEQPKGKQPRITIQVLD